MTGLAVVGIGELTGTSRPVLPDGAVLIDAQGIVAWSGPEADLEVPVGWDRVDVGGRAVIPGFVDSHTHLVFAGDRTAEWEARMAGLPYKAGGIRTTVAATRAAGPAALTGSAERWTAEALASGTTTIEIKSGYGLDTPTEAALLTAGRTVSDETTFLGAHVVPEEYAGRAEDYVDLVRGPMLAACAPLARWVDVFCEQGAFDADQARAVLTAGREAGLGLRVHGNQLRPGPGVGVACELGAASVDHCTHLTDADIDALAAPGAPVATLLPAVEFSCRSSYPPARRLIDAGATVALASDCNPGSAFTTSMPFVVALAVREMGMTVREAVWAATAGGAAALGRTDVGSLAPGCRGDLVVLEAPSAAWLGYRPGVSLVRTVVRGGTVVAGSWPAT